MRPPTDVAQRQLPTGRGEGGAAALITLLLTMLSLGVGSAVLGLTLDVAMAAARARTAADAAALAAAATSPLVSADVRGRGESAAGLAAVDPTDSAREAAQQVAVANGAQLRRIDLAGWPLRVAVRVAVAPRTQVARRVVGMSEAGATAAVRPTADRLPIPAALPWF